MTDIGDYVQRLIDAGCDPKIAAVVVSEVYIAGRNSADICGQSADISAQRRREYDRNRKRELRSKVENPRISAESADRLSLIEVSKKEREVKERKSRKTQIPPDWTPSISHMQLAAELNVPLADAETVFREDCAANGRLYADHNAAFSGYIRRYHKFNGARQNGHKPTLAERAFDLARQVREREIELNPVSEADIF